MDYSYIHNANATPEMYNRCRQNGSGYVSVGQDYGKSISVEKTITSGIRIIKNNYQKEHIEEVKNNNSIKINCDRCDSELEITEEDTYIGWLGARFITCPCCGEESMVDELDGITLTKDNLEFPVHFSRTTSGLRNVIEVGANKIIKEIQDVIMFLREHKDMDYKYVSYGDLFVIVFRYEGDENYFVLVTKDFYEVDIPFEKEDYE